MEQRVLGKTGRPVSVIGLGTWQLGADWGNVSESDALAVLRAAVESGVTFFDTADVYGDGRSERVIGRFIAGNIGRGVTVATKMGRRVDQVPANYVLDNFRAWTDRSRVNLGVDRLDLVQLHCPPTPVYSTDAVYDALDTLVAEDRVAAYGCDVPIIPGIMPVTSLKVIERAIELGGCRVPTELWERLQAVAEDRAAVREIGVEYAAWMCEQLLAEGVPGLHFYTLNWSRATREIYQRLGLAERGLPAAARSGSSAPITA